MRDHCTLSTDIAAMDNPELPDAPLPPYMLIEPIVLPQIRILAPAAPVIPSVTPPAELAPELVAVLLFEMLIQVLMPAKRAHGSTKKNKTDELKSFGPVPLTANVT